MNNDWKALTPHRPLDPGSEVYVTPPSGGARDIIDWILAGGSTVLIGGPAGIGKSTEVAQAARLLEGKRLACLVQVDRRENMRKLTPEQLLFRITERIAEVAIEDQKLPLSRELRTELVLSGALQGDDEARPYPGQRSSLSASELLRYTLVEVTRHASQLRLALLIDGLEKVPAGASATDLFDALGGLREDLDLVVVVPWHAAFGPRSDAVLRAGEKFIAMHAANVEGYEGEPGRLFLRSLLTARMDMESGEIHPERLHLRQMLVTEAAQWSGGIPRTFLQLLADAGTYARLRRNGTWPDAMDLADAVADQQESMRRVLLPGDTQAILAAEGSDGRELDLERKVRLMAHGVLLERVRERRRVLEIHPLARDAVREVRRSA